MQTREEITASNTPGKGGWGWGRTTDGATKRLPVTCSDQECCPQQVAASRTAAGRSEKREDREQVLRERADRQEQSVSVYSEIGMNWETGE